MSPRSWFLLVAYIAGFAPAFGQKLKKTDKALLANLQTDIKYLADDRLEGRRAGTAGEKLASDFILIQFQQIGLLPYGEQHGWLQPFDIYDGKEITPQTHFSINGQELLLNKEYFPLAFSPSKKAEGLPAMALQESGVPWFVDLREILEGARGNPHFDLEDALHTKVRDCQKKGAIAVIFYNSSKIDDELFFKPKDRSEGSTIPVLYVSKEGRKKYLMDESASLDVKINVSLAEKRRTGHNVIGYLDNHAPATILLGAHYDHLGYGEDGNSMYRGPEHLIHNGADDNASGTAAVIELARMLKQSKSKKYNYLFIAFSGEELGLFGSKYFTEHPTLALENIDCMINMDMVGRLNDSTRALTIGGYGTSPAWGELFADIKEKQSFNFKFDSSGSGPSDYTSFYRKDIPVLFFFTGLHSDYHKPTDDYDKINYLGELEVVKLIYGLMGRLENRGRLAFTKTRENQSGGNRSFKVTLGIMPDYTFSGTGIRVDGISEGRPAQKAGLKAGDVILRLGDFEVSNLDKYMEALSNFKKGDKTIVNYKRGNETSKAEVEF